MATEKFLHMRLTPEDSALLDALVVRMNFDTTEGNRHGQGAHPRQPTKSDAVRRAIAEALLRRCERA